MKPAPATRFPTESPPDPALRIRARIHAALLLASFTITAIFSHMALNGDRFLGARFEPCEQVLCVSWVMPTTWAWSAGARAGDPVLSIDGRPIDEFQGPALPKGAKGTFSFRDTDGAVVTARLSVIEPNRQEIVLGAFGALIAILGAIVLVRRPDLRSARIFGLFSLACSVGLGVGTAAGTSHRPWALILMQVCLYALGATFLPLSLALVERSEAWSRRTLLVLGLTATALLGLYGLAVIRFADWFSWLRNVGTLWLTASVIGSLGVLAILGTRQPADRRRPALVVLTGFAIGMLPFICLSLVPRMLGLPQLQTLYTITPIVAIPIAFAIAIIQYEMLGIRRLVHRGMVHGATGLILVLTVALVFGAFGAKATSLSNWTLALLVGVGAVVCRPLQDAVQRFIGRFVYRDALDYGHVIDTFRTDLVHAEQTHGVARALILRMVDSLQLESTLLFLGDRPATATLAVEAGPHAPHVAARLRDAPLPRSSVGKAVEFSWESNSMLLTPLSRGGRYLGHVLWGPKAGGEVFIDEERRVIEAMAPILTLVLEEHALSERLRDLNKRLLSAEEAERRRIAQDLHDGPLQKAALLGGLADGAVVDRRQIARELNAEIREICSRLRPAILDDLGLAPALEWLLQEAERHAGIEGRLHLERVEDDRRFSSDLELAFFRVTQESINNVIKHAKAATIDVSLTVEGDQLILRVCDDGVGFSDRSTRPGLGLPGMRERILQIGGRCEVRSDPGHGTELTASAPLPTATETEAHAH